MTAPTPATVDLSKYVETRLMGDRPHVRGRRLPVTFVASAYDNGQSIVEIMYNYTLSEQQVLAAILYYREHKTELDAQDEREQREWDIMRAKYGRKLTK
jgi:uncharacterized protein (DUF433 family)